LDGCGSRWSRSLRLLGLSCVSVLVPLLLVRSGVPLLADLRGLDLRRVLEALRRAPDPAEWSGILWVVGWVSWSWLAVSVLIELGTRRHGRQGLDPPSSLGRSVAAWMVAPLVLAAGPGARPAARSTVGEMVVWLAGVVPGLALGVIWRRRVGGTRDTDVTVSVDPPWTARSSVAIPVTVPVTVPVATPDVLADAPADGVGGRIPGSPFRGELALGRQESAVLFEVLERVSRSSRVTMTEPAMSERVARAGAVFGSQLAPPVGTAAIGPRVAPRSAVLDLAAELLELTDALIDAGLPVEALALEGVEGRLVEALVGAGSDEGLLRLGSA
jgi:hypothetical protein